MEKYSDEKLYKLTLSSNFLRIIVGMIISFVIVPMSINYWQTERYGIWLLINSMLVYLTVSNLGLNSAASILMNKNSNTNEKIEILKKSVIIVLISVLLLLVFFIFLNYNNENWIQILGKIPKNLIQETQNATFIMILFFLINVPFSLITSALNGFHKVYISNIFSIIGAILSLLAIMLNIYLKGDLANYAIIVGMSNLFINLLCLIYFYIYIYRKFRKKDEIIIELKEENSYKNIFKLGIRCFVGSVASMIVLNTDNIIISNYLGVQEVTPYALTFKLYMILFNIIFVLNSSIVPIIGRKISEKNVNDTKKIYDRTFYLILYTGGGIWIGSVALFKNLIILWSGIDGYAGFMTVFFLGAYTYVFATVNLNYIMLNTFNYLKGIVWLVWIEAIINLGASVLFIKYWGIGGVALGTFLGAFLGSMFLYPLVLKKKSHGSIFMNTKHLLKHTLIIVIPFVIVGSILFYFINVFLVNFLATLLLLSAYSLCSYLILPTNEKKYILNVIIGAFSKKGVQS